MRRFAIPMISLLLLSGSASSQQEAKKAATLQVEKADTVRTVLSRHVDRKVTLVIQGAELTGTVKSVGDGVVHLSDVAGREFYDAIVDLQKVSAVLVKVRGQ